MINTTILSIFIGIGGMFGWGLYDFLGGFFAKQIGPFKSLFWSQLTGFFSLLFLSFFLISSLNISILLIILCWIAAIIYASGYLFFFRGFEIGNISIVAATMNLWAVFTMIFAYLFMGQRLSPTQTVGVMMIIVGATLASIRWDELNNQIFQLSAGVRETVIGAFLFGIFWNISEIISEEMGWLLTTLSVKSGIILFLLLFSFLVKRDVGMSNSSIRTKTIVSLMGIIEASAVALVNYGLTIGDAILITPIASALSIVTITLAMIFLREKVTRLQGSGMILAVAGIVMTAF
ncbi:MAG: DMT family transporter [Anaerolineales bacterium]|nr:DMT family transporter [Anaerolineales bacterium]